MPRRRQEFDDFIVRDDDGMEVVRNFYKKDNGSPVFNDIFVG